MSSCVDIASLLLCFWSRRSHGFIGSLQTLKHHSPSELSSSLVPRCALDKGNMYPSANLFGLKRGFATACVERTLTRQLATTETQFCQTSTSLRDENKSPWNSFGLVWSEGGMVAATSLATSSDLANGHRVGTLRSKACIKS